MTRIAFSIFLLASIVGTCTFSTVGIGSVYAQNGPSGFIPREEFDDGEEPVEPLLPEAVPLESPSNESGQPIQSPAAATGASYGIIIGSINGTLQGAYARNLGLTLDPTYNYQRPTDEVICKVYVDNLNAGSGGPPPNLRVKTCDQSQREVSDFFRNFIMGYESGYSFGVIAGYRLALDQYFGPLAQPPTGESTTQPILPPFEEAVPEATQPPTGESTTQPILPPFEEAVPEATQPPS